MIIILESIHSQESPELLCLVTLSCTHLQSPLFQAESMWLAFL